MNFKTGMVLLSGPSSSGKTTWMKKHFNPQFDSLVSFNTFKEELYTQTVKAKPAEQSDIERYNEVWDYFDHQKDVFSKYSDSKAKKAFEFAKSTGGRVWIDNTNLSRRARAPWVRMAELAQMRIHAVEFWCKLDLLLNRNTTRMDQRIPVLNLRQQFNAQTECAIDLECDTFEVIKQL